MSDRRQAAQIESSENGRTLTESRRVVGQILRAANREGTIQAHDMLDITGRPELHSTTSVQAACDALGVGATLDLIRWERE